MNIPDSVKILECSNQLLIDVKLPLGIEKVDLSENIFNKFDANNLSKLVDLDISFNELTTLNNLPESLENLNIENNKLSEINLAETPKLKVLICSNNPILLLQHVPDSLTKIVMENNPFIEIERTSDTTQKQSSKKLNYLESINKYFKLKNDYEIKVRSLKHSAYKKGKNKKESRTYVNDVKIPCIYCTRNVGTQFYNKDQYYSAKCGDQSKPCDLDIQIFAGDYFRLEELMREYEYGIEFDKENIIIGKMESLFKHVSDNESTKNFEENIKEYKETNDLYKEVAEKYEEVYNNEEKKEAFKKQTELFYNIKGDLKSLYDEYKKTNDRKILITMINAYKTDFLPAIDKLRMLKYAHMYVDITESSIPVTTLKQFIYPAHSKDYVYGDEPKVEKFVMN